VHTDHRCQHRHPQRRRGHPQRRRDQGCPQWCFQCQRPRRHSRDQLHTDHRHRRRYLQPEREHGCSGDASADARDVTQESAQQRVPQSERATNLKSASSEVGVIECVQLLQLQVKVSNNAQRAVVSHASQSMHSSCSPTWRAVVSHA